MLRHTMTGRLVAAMLVTALIAAAPAPPRKRSDQPDAPPPPPPQAKPIGNPGGWIPADAYPATARNSQEEGRVAFQVEVDSSGMPMTCKVLQSSGSPLLDDTTCYFMTLNGRFTPPRNAKNKPVESVWKSAVTWKLAVAAPPPAPVSTPAPAPAATAGPVPKN